MLSGEFKYVSLETVDKLFKEQSEKNVGMKQEIALSMMNEDYFFNFMSLRTISVRDDTCHED